MARGHGPEVRRRRLASELRRLRESAELTIGEVSDRLRCSTSKVSRIETGHVGVRPQDVRAMLTLYGVGERESDELVQLAHEARTRGWWHSYSEVFTGSFVGLEADASSLRAFQALLVPGLLQTRRYAHAVIRAMRPHAPDAEIKRRVSARMRRQRLLADESPPSYEAVMDEAVLHRVVGGRDVMSEQLLRLREAAALPHVTLRVVPFDAGAHSGMEGPFLILGFPERADPDVVYVDSTTGGVCLEEPDEVERYSVMFDHLRYHALGHEDSTRLLDKLSGAAHGR
ncbi:helix-turn-helix domain-containing protein [Haloechinothrix sp. YIM 98757]|uniref:Helix-turn-helix domain-containing protein n=1 Tax=Haloechinothrix aidingensis TaxID=2752311 RepID=A0A838A5C4_9PSEU|nr:helix-turn-helix transcriptional regulator [Haloechinothrix aidingensis]MBA0124930.1 helix-turn-helix domain-containing protein [Haloechinothrix aidingensis]